MLCSVPDAGPQMDLRGGRDNCDVSLPHKTSWYQLPPPAPRPRNGSSGVRSDTDRIRALKNGICFAERAMRVLRLVVRRIFLGSLVCS